MEYHQYADDIQLYLSIPGGPSVAVTALLLRLWDLGGGQEILAEPW